MCWEGSAHLKTGPQGGAADAPLTGTVAQNSTQGGRVQSEVIWPAVSVNDDIEPILQLIAGSFVGAADSIVRLKKMCHNVHMKTISIRELHLKTGRWVRHAASRGPIVVTDRGRRVAALQPFDASVTGRPLPNREAAIRKRSKVPVDSAVYLSELREGR